MSEKSKVAPRRQEICNIAPTRRVDPYAHEGQSIVVDVDEKGIPAARIIHFDSQAEINSHLQETSLNNIVSQAIANGTVDSLGDDGRHSADLTGIPNDYLTLNNAAHEARKAVASADPDIARAAGLDGQALSDLITEIINKRIAAATPAAASDSVSAQTSEVK